MLWKIIFLLPIAFLVTLEIAWSNPGTTIREAIQVDNIEREYWVYLPANYSTVKKWPLVLAFHGGGGTAKGAMALYNFNSLADQEGFLAVYPQGIQKGWNDGRISTRKQRTDDDVKFVSLLLEHLAQQYAVDSRRVFSTGLSNGAIFSIYLASKIPDKILAIAPVSGGMPSNLEHEFKLSIPVSALFINGTSDKLVPFTGGPVVSERAGRGEVIGAEKLITHWIDFDGCSGSPKETNMPDLAPQDHCTASMRSWSGCGNSSELVFVKIHGGGHTWPGGKQYAPRFIVGEVCRDFRAEEMIWEFFKRQKSRQ